MPLPALLGGLGRIGGGRALSKAAARSSSKVGKDPLRRAAAEKRLGQMKAGARRNRRNKLGRDFLEGALNSQGLNTDAIANNKRSSAGGLLRSLGYNAGQDGFDYNSPPLDIPERVSKVSNPTISSLEKQLKAIAKTAADLGVITKKQQEQLLKEALKTEAATKEQQLEQPDATPLAAEGVGDSIGPADSAVEQLLQSLRGLQDIIDDKVRDAQQTTTGNLFMEGMLDSLGLGGVKQARAAKRATPQLNKGFKQTSGGAFLDTKTGKYVKPEQALKNFKTVDPSHLSKAAKARQATAVLGKSSSRVASALGSVTGKVSAGAKIGKEAIAKIAKPLVTKSLVKTGIKSIPIVGAVAGGIFALGRLLKGDVVGAGLDAASGLGGPLTAIPALVLSLSRDVYTGAFGVAPETDPQVGPRMALVKGTVEDLAKEALSQKVTRPSQGATATRQKQASITPPAPSASPAAPAGGAAAPQATQTAAPPPSSAAPAPSQSGGGAAPQQATAAAQPEPGASESGGTAQQVSEQAVGKKLEGEEGGAPSASAAAPEVKSITGEKILQASTEAPPTAASMGMTGSSPPKPATLPTTKGRAKGMGDVPEPTYVNLGSIAKQLYFGSVAGVMAA